MTWRTIAWSESDSTVDLDSDGHLAMQRAMSEVGYRGMAEYETEDEARTAAADLKRRLNEVAPEFRWKAAWVGPETYQGGVHVLGCAYPVRDDDG